ncbi:MAG: TA system VapC family ribonuclease toxin [Pirellulaceae bacterium]|nr:hypothetical protein [Planctomycetales bacterium]
MIALLDVNLLIALFDASHVHHQQAHQWFAGSRSQRWATCPLTQNACIRIISQPAYPNRLPAADVARRLHAATPAADHDFWFDDISLADPSLYDLSQLPSSKHLTDAYLLGLAAKNGGRLVTFDKGIPTSSVLAADSRHLLVL